MSSFFSISAPLQPENESCFPKLNYQERLIGFGICCGLGWFIQLMSFGATLSLLTGSPEKLAITYSLGNILSILGTSFLIGFKKQFENMKDKDRRNTSIIFVISLILTFIFSLVIKIKILVLICLIIQFCAYIWYVASYIPFARSCLKSGLNKVIQPCKKALQKS